jgi:signal transduction histidine kinase
MDEETVFGLLVFLFFLTILTLPLSITACIAASTTRRWSKEKARRFRQGTLEAEPFVEDSDSELADEDILDSEDEEYYTAKREQKQKEREERQKDWQLTAKQKFFKEYKKCWTGPAGGRDQLAKEKEMKDQEERRKIAREAVREYLRLERKRARKGQMAKKEGADAMELPSYKKVLAERDE